MYEWRTGRYCVFKNNVHLVFVTKYRRNVFNDSMLARMRDIINETCQQMDTNLIEFGGEDDHIHILVSIPPKLAIANLVGKLKGKSAYFLRREFWPELKNKLWGKHLWSPSYCVVSCGEASLSVIKEYVKNQRIPAKDKQVKQAKALTKVKLEKAT